MTARTPVLGVAAFLGVAAIVGGSFAGLLGLGVRQAAGDFLPKPPPDCPAQLVAAAPLAGLAVKVHNSAKVEGLAASTAKTLKSHGVKVVSVGNKAAPEMPGKIPGVIIAGSGKHLPEAVAIQALFPGSVFLLDDAEPEPSIYLTKVNPKTGSQIDPAATALRCAVD